MQTNLENQIPRNITAATVLNVKKTEENAVTEKMHNLCNIAAIRQLKSIALWRREPRSDMKFEG